MALSRAERGADVTYDGPFARVERRADVTIRWPFLSRLGWSTATRNALRFHAVGLVESWPVNMPPLIFASKSHSGPPSVVAPSIAEQPGLKGDGTHFFTGCPL